MCVCSGYAAEAQAHLPMHSDESHFSLTLALNGGGEFEGGGTYFGALRRAVAPAVGHLVAFEGGLLHGGEPVSRGVRYILACFMYVDDCGEGGVAGAGELSGGVGGGGGGGGGVKAGPRCKRMGRVRR